LTKPAQSPFHLIEDMSDLSFIVFVGTGLKSIRMAKRMGHRPERPACEWRLNACLIQV